MSAISILFSRIQAPKRTSVPKRLYGPTKVRRHPCLVHRTWFRYGRMVDRVHGPEDAEQGARGGAGGPQARGHAGGTRHGVRKVFSAVAGDVGGVVPDADFATVARYDGDAVVGGWTRTGDDVLGRRSRLGGLNVSGRLRAQGLVSDQALAAEDTTPLTAAARATGIRSSVGAPISVERRLWGVMIVASTREDGLPEGIEEAWPCPRSSSRQPSPTAARSAGGAVDACWLIAILMDPARASGLTARNTQHRASPCRWAPA